MKIKILKKDYEILRYIFFIVFISLFTSFLYFIKVTNVYIIMLNIVILCFIFLWDLPIIGDNDEGQYLVNILIFMSFIFLIIFIYILYEPFILYGTIPLGWDTSQHLNLLELLKDKGIFNYIEYVNNNGFLYTIVIYIVNFLFNDIFITRIIIYFILPIIFIILYLNIYRKSSKDNPYYLLLLISMVSYLSLYRLSSDLHKTLFSYILFLIYLTTWVLYGINKKNYLKMTLIVMITSFTQIESSIFFYGIIMLTELLHARKPNTINYLCIFTILLGHIPSIILVIPYLSHVFPLSYPIIIRNPPITEIFKYFNYPLIFIPFFGFKLLIFNNKSHITKKKLFFITYLFIVAIVNILSIIKPIPFSKYSGRILYLFPIPFLVYEVLIYLIKLTTNINVNKKVKLTLVFIIIISIIIPPTIYTYNNSKIHLRPFIKKSTYESLRNSNLNNVKIPFFLYSKSDPSTIFMFDNWVGATIGDHFSYIGSIYSLITLDTVNGSNPFLNNLSELYVEKIRKAGLNNDDVLSHPIYIVKEFYKDKINENYWIEIMPNIYKLNITNITDLYGEIEVYFYNSINNVSKAMTLSKESFWIQSSIKIYVEEPYDKEFVSMYFPIIKSGEYNVSLEYYDTTKYHSPITIYINNEYSGTIYYNGSMKPTIYSFSYDLSRGKNLITFSLEDINYKFYAILYKISYKSIV